MTNYIWPIVLVVLSNIAYHICAKSTSADIDPLASLVIVYLIGALVSGILYFVTNKGGSLIREFSHMNWASVVLGVAIVGLEVGTIYAYRVGWEVSREAIVQSSFLAVALFFIGWVFFHENPSLNKAVGIVVCLAGLYIINK